MRRKVSAIALLVLVMVIWGSAYAVTKASLAEIPPMLLAFLRNFVASVLLVAFAQMRGAAMNSRRTIPWAMVALMGLTGVCLYYLGFNASLVYTTASQGALIESFIPIVTALLAALFLKEKLTAKRMLGIGFSIAGVVLLIFRAAPPEATAPNPILGNALMLGTVVIWAIYTILAKRLADFDQLTVTAHSTAIGTLLLAPFALFELWGKSFPEISAGGWLSVLYLGAAASAGAYWLYNRSLKYLEAGQTAQFMNLLPIVGVATAVLFLGESLALWQVVGGALALIGVWSSLQNERKKI